MGSMHLGFGKHPDAKLLVRNIDDEYTNNRRPLSYRPPLIFSATFGQPLLDGNISRFHGVEAGTFEVKATGDAVKAYALLWLYNDTELDRIGEIHHRQVCQILKKLLHVKREFGRVVLGGGFIIAEYDKRILRIFGQSGDYGRVPNFMGGELFRGRKYDTHVEGFRCDSASPGIANMVSATNWYLAHGIDVDST